MGSSRRHAPPLITLDTSAIVCLLDRRERDHQRVRAAFVGDGGPHLVPALILAETCYVTGLRLGQKALRTFLEDLDDGRFAFECGDGDIGRIRQLIARYDDLPLSVADAAVVACAERNGGRVLSIDADFDVVAKEGKIVVLPG
jgi:predicted nucleic acid-binding protein